MKRMTTTRLLRCAVLLLRYCKLAHMKDTAGGRQSHTSMAVHGSRFKEYSDSELSQRQWYFRSRLDNQSAAIFLHKLGIEPVTQSARTTVVYNVVVGQRHTVVMTRISRNTMVTCIE